MLAPKSLDFRPPLLLGAALLASLTGASCGSGEPVVTPTAPASTEAEAEALAPPSGGGAPDLASLQVQVSEADSALVDSSLRAPDPAEIPELEGLVLTQELPAASGRPDPSLERLEPLTEWSGIAVQFYEERYPDGGLRLQGHRTTTSGDSPLAHGPEWRWFENGQLERRREFQLGKVDGMFQEWHESGIQKLEGQLELDFPVGRWVRWNALGPVWKVQPFVDGALDGVEYVFFGEGTLNQRVIWSQGKKNGEEFIWSKRGLPLEHNGWKNGKRHGVRRQWQGQGRLGLDTTFVEGKRDGAFRQYWKSGDLHLQGQFEMGDRVGEWRQWGEAGLLASVEHYAGGEFDGRVQRWNAQEILVFEGDFALGKAIGTHRSYYDGGGPKSEQVYVDGVLEGPKTTWHPNGVKASEGRMKADARHGEWTLWDAEGDVLEAWSGRYENGEKVTE